jgi:hypothetical protein
MFIYKVFKNLSAALKMPATNTPAIPGNTALTSAMKKGKIWSFLDIC